MAMAIAVTMTIAELENVYLYCITIGEYFRIRSYFSRHTQNPDGCQSVQTCTFLGSTCSAYTPL